jgi:flagellar motor switch/type III secretory pathway protein FliN
MVVLGGEPSTTWRFKIPALLTTPAILLNGSQTDLALSLSEDGLCERVGDREWWDYQGPPRALAWAVAHQRLIDGLGQLLGEPLMPYGFAGENALPTADPLTTFTLGFSVNSSDGRRAAGVLKLSTTLASRLASHRGWQRSDLLGTRWSQLPTRLRIELQGVDFPLAELKGAEFGDVLVLGRQSQCLQALTVVAMPPRSDTPLRQWSAAASAEGIIISSNASLPSPKSQQSPLDSLPLDFALATLSVPLAELASFKPGYLLKLPGSLIGRRAEILSRDNRIGQGDLRAAGEMLGIQLLARPIARNR